MPNCLGIYTENNIIKYAKLDSDKNGTSFKLASYGVRFSENTQETIEEIRRYLCVYWRWQYAVCHLFVGEQVN